jgi:hypothetical protein
MILEEYTVIYSVSNPASIPGTYQYGIGLQSVPFAF